MITADGRFVVFTSPSANLSVVPDANHRDDVFLAEPAAVCGDVDENGVVNVKDAALALRLATGQGVATASQLRRADYNRTQAVDVADVVRILRAAVGLGDTAGPLCPG